MATWKPENVLLTLKGNEALSKVLAGQGKLTVTRIVAGAGYVSPSTLYNQKDVSNIKQTLEVNRVVTDANGSEISTTLSNINLDTAYNLYQIGVYCKHTDSDEEFLYLIAQCETDKPDNIPAKTDTVANFSYNLYIQHEGTTQFEVTVNQSGVLDVSMLGKPNGVATLDSSGKVPSEQIPSLEYAAKKHASQHATGGSDPITPASIGAMPSMKRTFIYDGINSTKNLTTAGWYRILKHDSLNDKAFLINIGHQYSDTGPENVLFFVCSMPSCPSIVVLSHSNNPSRPTIIFYKKIRITKDSNYMYIDFYRAQDGDVCIPRVSIIEFVTDATTVQDKKGEPLDVLPVDEAPDGETVLLMQDVSVIPSGNVLTDANKAKSVAITLTASGWNSSSKTQTVTVSGVLADETKQLITPTPALASQTAYYEAVVLCTGQAANKLTFTAKKIPTADLTVYVTIQEVSA